MRLADLAWSEIVPNRSAGESRCLVVGGEHAVALAWADGRAWGSGMEE